MRPSQVRAWILLAVPGEPKPLHYVLGMADGLNKAIPTLAELRDSFGWLQAADLIVAEAGAFQRTDQGRRLIARCEHPGENAFDLWDKVEATLDTLRVDVDTPFELSAEDLQKALDDYHQWFLETYERLKSEDP